MKKTTPLMLLCVGADVLLAVWDLERPSGTEGSVSPEHTELCFSFGDNERHPRNEAGKGRTSLLKSRQFLIKTTSVFFPEILSSGVVPCNLSLLPVGDHP